MRAFQSLCALTVTTLTATAFAPVRSSYRPAAVSASNWWTGVRSSSSSSSTSVSMSAEDFAKQEIAGNKVVIFSKSFCPFCKKTKKVFTGLNVDAKIYELNEMDNGADLQAALLDISGQKTVPNVFINGEHVGGNDDVQAANRSGKLQTMLESAGIETS